MSRYLIKRDENVTIAYGFDPIPHFGGYFFQKFDNSTITDENPEGLVINEGFLGGLPKNKMVELMMENGVQNHSHLTFVAMDLPI
jgi:hypothetical protein